MFGSPRSVKSPVQAGDYGIDGGTVEDADDGNDEDDEGDDPVSDIDF
jgi:hypothetical protein